MVDNESRYEHLASERDDRNRELETKLHEVLARGLDTVLSTDSYETASEALKGVADLRRFRSAAARSIAPGVYKLSEYFSAISGSNEPAELQSQLSEMVVADLQLQSQRLSPRVADFYMQLLAAYGQVNYEPRFENNVQKIAELQASGDLDLLADAEVPLNLKLDRLEKRIEPFLRGLNALDNRERKFKKESVEQAEDIPTPVPPAREESHPTMDEMERLKEGEPAHVFWSIQPGFGGYYREQAFDQWDHENNKWEQSEYRYRDITTLEEADNLVDIIAQVQTNQWTRLPHSDMMDFVKFKSIGGKPIVLKQDQHGDYIFYVRSSQSEIITLTAHFAQREEPVKRLQDKPPALYMPARLTPETEAELQRIATAKKGNKAKALAISAYIIRSQKYSNESKYNEIYRTDEDGFFGSIDKHKQSDCDVANSYFAAMCSKLDIPVRHVVGHMVKGKNTEGASQMTSGTGHGWSEIWDADEQGWIRVDATPPGDPLRQEDEKSGLSVEGDYGSREAIGSTDEELRQLEQQLENLTEKLSYTREERVLSERAGVSLKEARSIVKEIREAESTKLPNGQLVIDVLTKLFNLIVESRKFSQPQDTGPLRRREGGEHIEDVVSHYVGIESGDVDPASRNIEQEVIKEQLVFGGFDVYIVGDKSGSMNETVDGEEKWKLQRRAMYLILGALHSFEQSIDRAKAALMDPLTVRTQSISFRGSEDEELDVDKPLTNSFEPEDKVKLWKSLGNQGSGNGDVPALALIRDQIKAEIAENEAKTKKPDNRLRVIFACSDGYPDDEASVRQLAKELGDMNAVVIGVGLTETAAKIPIIFNTPHSRGVLVEDLNDLPAVVAKHVILEAIKLFPDRSREQVQAEIAQIVAKFEKV